MRTLTDREKRTIRLGAIGIGIYLLVFSGKVFHGRRAEYDRLLQEARRVSEEARRYENKVLVLKKLMTDLHLDPAQLSKKTVVAEASSAMQKAATGKGIQMGPVREAPGRNSAREMASVKLEGVGPVPAVMSFLHELDAVGFPLIIESVQISPDPTRPGNLKLNLTVIIMDFEGWKGEETTTRA